MASVQRLQHASVPMPPGGEAEARRFYGDALGLQEVEPPAAIQHLRLVWFRVGDGDEIHCFTEAAGPNCAAQHVCLQVDDLDVFRTRLAEHGVAIEESIAIPNRPRCFVTDPFGNGIELTQITGPYD